MKPSLQLAHNAVIARLIGADKEVKNIVSEILSYVVEGAEHSPAFGPVGRGWDGRSSFFRRTDCTFPAGFVHMVHGELLRFGYTVQLVRKKAPSPLGPDSPIVDEFSNADPRYDYQLRALTQVERHGRGIIRVATGGGKSKIAKLIAARYRRMTLFVTTRGVLMYQMRDAFVKDCAFNVGIIGDGQWSPVRGVNVGMVQTIVAQLQETTPEIEAKRILKLLHAAEQREIEALKRSLLTKKTSLPRVHSEIEKLIKAQEKRRPKDATIAAQALERSEAQMKTRARMIRLLEMVEVVIGEEAHEAGGNSYYEILRHCKNAHIRVALTATPFMRSDAEDNMRLMAAFGPILINVSEDLLIKRGILAKPYFKFTVSKPHPKLYKSTPWQKAYTYGYVENPFMTADIVRDAVRARDHGLPVMTLVQRTAHGAALMKAMEAAGLRVDFIRGEDDQLGRKRSLVRLGNGEIDVLIGTTILDVGVDVPAVGLVQLAGGGKAEVAMRQRIGRGLRSKKKGPNVAFVNDYTTEPNSHLKDHARTRRAIVEQTPGFVEGILPGDKDLPWEIFAPTSVRAA